MITSAFTFLRTMSAWVWEASWQATALALIVMLIQRALGRQLPARWRNALWLLVFARLLMPALPDARFSAYNWFPKKAPAAATVSNAAEWRAAPVVAIETPRIGEAGESGNIPPTPNRRTKAREEWPPIPVLPLAWGAGCLITLAWGIAGYVRLRKKIRRLQQTPSAALQEQFEAAKVESKVRRATLIVSEAVATPMVTGFWRARIILPADLESTLTPDDFRMVFLHELGHLKRGDLKMAWLAWVAGILHWFNPAIRFVMARARKDREMACDEWVLRFISDSHAYGSALVRILESAQSPTPHPGAIGIFESKSALLQRVRRIAAYRRPTVFGSAVGLALLILVGAVTLTGASNPAGSDHSKGGTGHDTFTIADGEIKAIPLEARPSPAFDVQNALMHAIVDDDLATAEKALDDGANANGMGESQIGQATPFFGEVTPLYLAARESSFEMVKLLVSHGADVNQKSSNGRPIAYVAFALQTGHTETARYLHDLGVACDSLTYAAGTGDLEAVKKLKEAAKPEAVRHAATNAAANNQINTLTELIDGKPIDPEALFRSAASAGALESMRFLIGHGVDVKKAGYKALSDAAYHKQAAAVAFLLKQGVNPTRADQSEGSPLSGAAEEGSLEVVKMLLDAGADPNGSGKDAGGPLIQACVRDRVDIVKLLLDHGARLDVIDKNGYTPLASAASFHAPRCIELMVARGADIKFTHPARGSILAMAQNYVGEDALPKKHGADWESRAAVSKGVKTFDVLLDNGADINAPGYQGLPPIAKAAASGQTGIFDLLLKRGADVNRKDDEGGTPLIRAIMPYFADKPRVAMIDKLLAKGADVNIGIDNPSAKGGTPSALKAAMIGGNCGGSAEASRLDAIRKLVAGLLAHGARFPVSKGSDAEQMLIAATTGDLDAVQKLLARGVSPDASDTKGWTPLMSAGALGYSAMMKALVDAGADVNARDAAGLTPLWLTVSTNPHAADIQFLLEKRADLNASADFFGPPLLLAVHHNNVSLARELLKRGADPNAGSAHVPSSLLHASVWSQPGKPEIASLLLEYGANPNPECYENRTPLYWAIDDKLTGTVKALLKAGADPTKVDDYKMSIWEKARDSGNEEIKELVKAALERKGSK
jgi:ankyrin repeat protein/beta-lactamase regulating signal transducer with metallopeptidase domain